MDLSLAAPVSSTRERELVALARSGDAAAFETLFRAFERPLLRVIAAHAHRSVRRAVEPRDVLQEIALTAWSELARCEAREPHELFAWLAGIARHRVASVARAVRPKTRPRKDAALALGCIGELDGERESPADRDAPVVAAGELATLRSDERAALLLRERFGMSWESIGFVLARRVDAVRMLHVRAVRRLQRASR